MRYLAAPCVAVCLGLACISFVHAEVLELEGTVKAIDATAQTMSVERKTPKGTKTLEFDVNKKAGDLSSLKVGDRITFSYDPDLEIVTKLGSAAASAAQSRSSEPTNSTDSFLLFNGENLNGWKFVGDKNERDEIWQVSNRILTCSGKEGAILLTDAKYRDFALSLEWRIPEGVMPTQDGLGLVFRCPTPSEVATRGLRYQLNDRPNVALWTLGASSKPSVGKGRLEESFQSPLVLSKNNGRKPLGEWNTLLIACKGDTVTVTHNGDEAIKVSGVDSFAGHIGFAPTGTRVELRNLLLKPD